LQKLQNSRNKLHNLTHHDLAPEDLESNPELFQNELLKESHQLLTPRLPQDKLD